MSYAVAGRLNGIFPEVGTILGPIWTGELVVVREVDERGAILGWSTRDDFRAARDADAPRSLTELRLA